MRVFCYFNLHKKCFSVRALDGQDKGRVIAHADGIHLSSVKFRVSQAGRARVLLERRKNVHAGAVGELTSFLRHGDVLDENWTVRRQRFEEQAQPVSYNPYRNDTFINTLSGDAILVASECFLFGRSALAIA